MDFTPAGQFEMMMKGAHFEYPFSGQLEGSHLDNDRKSLQHKNQAQKNKKKLCPGHHGNTGNRTAQGQGTGIPHEYFSRVVIKEQKSDTAAGQNDDEISQIIETGHIAEHGIGRESNDAASRSQSIKTVSEVHRIGCAHNNKDHEGIVQKADGNIRMGKRNSYGIGQMKRIHNAPAEKNG